jgi:multidrug efflux pump subunit AcrA (membrane-fusion protein)
MRTLDVHDRGLIFLLLIAGALALTSCSKQEEKGQPVVTVQVAKAERGEIQQIISAEAILFPRNQAAITPKVVAPVKAFYVNRGSRVHAGELLAVLENRDLAASAVDNKGAYEEAQANYGIATASTLPEDWQKAEYDLKTAKEAYDAQQKVYDSRQLLYKEGAMPRKDLDAAAVALAQAKSQFELAQQHLAALQRSGKKDQLQAAKGQLASAQGKYENAAAQLSYTEIRSPIDGVVTDRPSYPGETPAPGTPLLTVMDTSSVIAKAHIPQEQAAALKVGDAATIVAPGDIKAGGKVALVSPALDPNSTTVEVWVEAPNPGGSLRPGTSVHIEAVAQTLKDVVIIPASAVVETPGGGEAIMLVRDGVAHQVAVETGIRQGERIQITKGLAGEETVIISGAYALPDNTKVKIAAAAPDNAKPQGTASTADEDKN